MSRFVLTVMLVLLTIGPVFSPNSANAAPELTQSDLARVLHRYSGIRKLEVNFKQTKSFKDISLKLKSDGRLIVERPDRLVWRILKPAFIEVEIKSGDVSVTSGTGPDKSVQKFKQSQSGKDPQARSLQAVAAWFSLDPALLIKDYRVEKISEKSFKFIPRDPTLTPFTTLDLNVNGDGSIRNAVIFEVSGDRLDITFGKPTIAQAPSPGSEKK